MLRNIERIKANILQWLEEYKERTHCRGVVLGISGGKDSTVVAMLAKKVWGDNVLGVLMPNGSQADLDDSLEIAEMLGINFRVINIGNIYDSLLEMVEDDCAGSEYSCGKVFNVTDKSKTNIPPRLRMTVLYAVAQSLGYRVIGTGNASEAYIGWCTKWGDTACDLNPLAHITCTEVIELGKNLAQEFGLSERFAVKAPADGLSGKSDEDNFGFTYAVLDRYILTGECDDEAVAERIKQMHEITEHKRAMPVTSDIL